MELYRGVFEARARALGPEHPDTLTARTNLARWTGETGNLAGASDECAALLPIRERASGPEHADTLTTRAKLANWTGQRGTRPGPETSTPSWSR